MVELPKFIEGYISGVKRFIQNTFSRFAVGDEITCPCKKCHNRKFAFTDLLELLNFRD